MKTFEEIKDRTLAEYTSMRYRTEDRTTLTPLEKEGCLRTIDEHIDNIDEVTTILIGSHANRIIHSIQEAYNKHLNDYFNNFERFLEEHITGFSPYDDKPSCTPTYDGAQISCLYLSIGNADLAWFKGHSPFEPEVCDLFRQHINNAYGTNIPMSGVLEQAKQDYDEVCYSGDQTAKDKTFVHWMEARRDSGDLLNGGTCYLLATNQEYQEAKARCAEKTI